MAIRPTARPGIPPLESGDRLTSEEFERRYFAMPEGTRAELVEGVVYVASPVRTDVHGEPHMQMAKWAGLYTDSHPRVRAAIDSTVRLDASNNYQPDLSLRYQPGQSTVTETGYIEGAPELVAEISASSVSIDVGAKKAAYARHGVQEYLVWRVLDGELDWFDLQSGKYIAIQPDERGIINSRVFPGLRLNVRALLAGDYAAVSRTQFEANTGLQAD